MQLGGRFFETKTPKQEIYTTKTWNPNDPCFVWSLGLVLGDGPPKLEIIGGSRRTDGRLRCDSCAVLLRIWRMIHRKQLSGPQPRGCRSP